MAQKKRGPGRPRTVENRLNVGLTEHGERAKKHLLAKWPGCTLAQVVNAALEEKAKREGMR